MLGAEYDQVFDADSDDEDYLSGATYNVIIGLVLCCGFLVNWLIVRNVATTSWVFTLSPVIFLIAYFVSCFFGLYLYRASAEPAISFIGNNFVVVPFGLVLHLVVSRYNPTIVLQAIKVTAMVTIVMIILGALLPWLFEEIFPALTVALLAVLVFELVQIFFIIPIRGGSIWLYRYFLRIYRLQLGNGQYAAQERGQRHRQRGRSIYGYYQPFFTKGNGNIPIY